MHGLRACWETAVKDRTREGIFGFDLEADVCSARLLYACFSHNWLSDRQASSLGLALHYAFGAFIGTLYAGTGWGERWFDKSGVAFGSVLWLGADEIPISLSGISHPFKRGMASHASALVVHIAFGITLEQMLRASRSGEHGYQKEE